MTRIFDELQKQECGYQSCNRTSEYCEKGISAEGCADTCIPCSRICNVDELDDIAIQRCVSNCPGETHYVIL